MAFEFELVSPEALILSGEAEQVVVPGTEGYFTVLENHSAMMSTIKPGVINVKTTEGDTKHFFVRGGFADISASGLTILAEQAVAVDDMDLADLQKEIEQAREAHRNAEAAEHKEKAANVLAELEDSLVAIQHTKGMSH